MAGEQPLVAVDGDEGSQVLRELGAVHFGTVADRACAVNWIADTIMQCSRSPTPDSGSTAMPAEETGTAKMGAGAVITLPLTSSAESGGG